MFPKVNNPQPLLIESGVKMADKSDEKSESLKKVSQLSKVNKKTGGFPSKKSERIGNFLEIGLVSFILECYNEVAYGKGAHLGTFAEG